MNILIYNLLNEIDNSLTGLIENSTNSIFFAVSLADLKRITLTNKMDLLIMKIDSEINPLIDFIISKNPTAEFHILSRFFYPGNYDKVNIYPLNCPLENIINKIKVN